MAYYIYYFVFFFSSRRRHTRSDRDWSSDVCSSDLRLAVRITGSEQDAEEVVQDALWTATRKIDTFRGDSALGTWLHRIAVNAANQKRRARRSRRNEVSRDELFPPFGGQDQP